MSVQVFVAGCTGNVGSRAVRELLAQGFKVSCSPHCSCIVATVCPPSLPVCRICCVWELCLFLSLPFPLPPPPSPPSPSLPPSLPVRRICGVRKLYLPAPSPSPSLSLSLSLYLNLCLFPKPYQVWHHLVTVHTKEAVGTCDAATTFTGAPQTTWKAGPSCRGTSMHVQQCSQLSGQWPTAKRQAAEDTQQHSNRLPTLRPLRDRMSWEAGTAKLSTVCGLPQKAELELDAGRQQHRLEPGAWAADGVEPGGPLPGELRPPTEQGPVVDTRTGVGLRQVACVCVRTGFRGPSCSRDLRGGWRPAARGEAGEMSAHIKVLAQTQHEGRTPARLGAGERRCRGA